MTIKGLREYVARLRHRTIGSINKKQNTIDECQSSLDLSTEIRVARGVNKIDLRSVPHDRSSLSKDRDAALTFLVVRVHDPVDDLLMICKYTGGAKKSIDEGRLAVVDVRDQRNVPEGGGGHGEQDTERSGPAPGILVACWALHFVRQEEGNAMSDFNSQIIDEFRANDGIVGGMFEGAPLLVLHTTGAKSGIDRESPLMYLDHNERLFVFASAAGADSHPDWYHNVRANPSVAIEIGTERVDKTAVALELEDRDSVFAEQASRYPQFAEYATGTDRIIPVVELLPSGSA